jgi:hypothetical protein
MRPQLHLSCFIGVTLVLLACRPAPEREIDEAIPAPAPEVAPVPTVPPNPTVTVPRPSISGVNAPPPAPPPGTRTIPETPPPPPSVDTLRPAPPRDVTPSIPLDTIR